MIIGSLIALLVGALVRFRARRRGRRTMTKQGEDATACGGQDAVS